MQIIPAIMLLALTMTGQDTSSINKPPAQHQARQDEKQPARMTQEEASKISREMFKDEDQKPRVDLNLIFTGTGIYLVGQF